MSRHRGELAGICGFRDDLRPSDPSTVREIVASAGFFYDHEIEVAVQLVNESLSTDQPNGYHFLFAEVGGRTIGYSCFGEIPCTVGSFDLYWIAVHEARHGRGLGRAIMTRTEDWIAALGGRRIYAETSSREQYRPTRAFYERCAFRAEARLEAFYAPADDKIVYVKAVDVSRA